MSANPTGATRELVAALYSAATRSDIDAVLACMHTEIVIEEAPHLPFGGRYRGHDGVVRLFGAVSQVLDMSRLRVASRVVDGVRGVVVLEIRTRRSDDVVVTIAEEWVPATGGSGIAASSCSIPCRSSRHSMSRDVLPQERQTRVLTGLLLVALLASIAHFADNYVNYDAYPQSDAIPTPPDVAVLLLWFAFTAAGAAGYVLVRRGARRRGVVLLAIYSGSGLGGFGHYATVEAFHMPWWRQAAIGVDIACGLAIVGFVVWAMRS